MSRCIVTFIADDGSPVTGIDGLVIYMYHREHGPAHFHAEYGEYEITVDIASGIVHGKFLRRALNLVLEWYDQHRGERPAKWTCRRSCTVPSLSPFGISIPSSVFRSPAIPCPERTGPTSYRNSCANRSASRHRAPLRISAIGSGRTHQFLSCVTRYP